MPMPNTIPKLLEEGIRQLSAEGFKKITGDLLDKQVAEYRGLLQAAINESLAGKIQIVVDSFCDEAGVDEIRVKVIVEMAGVKDD